MSDKRFTELRHLNLEYDVSYIRSRYTRLEFWQERAEELREQLLMSAGLLPMREKTPLNAVMSGRIERDGYSVEKVHVESFPGFYVAGNLYRPAGKGPFPGILNPHGHWKEGRLENNDACSVPGRCINFALQGYVAFAYDMVDYVDSRQWDHRRINLRDRLWGITTGGLQLRNSMRALDFLQSLPDVDPDRIACTGASGGGTQTFLLCAVDGRVKVCAPVNMISSHMQGGCVCENLPGLRIDTNNVEIGALMAPRPMIVISATGDWTKNTVEVEYPAIRHIYSLFGAEDRVECVRVDAGHNYNRQSREAVYAFFGRWLPSVRAGLQIPPDRVSERPFEVEKEGDLKVFPNGMPDGALDTDGIVEALIWASEAQLDSCADKADAYRPALARALALPGSFDISEEVVSQETDVDICTKRVILQEKTRGAAIPVVVVEPTDVVAEKVAVVVDGPGGRSFMESGAVRKLVEQGWRIVSTECFGNKIPETPGSDSLVRDLNDGFFDTYNRTDTQERVYEIVVSVLWAAREADRIALVGSGMGGPLCLLAAPFAEAVTDVAADMCGLDLSTDDVFIREFYVPGLRRAGDFRTAEILCPPRQLVSRDAHPSPSHVAEWLCGE